jgi:hypothetical protein
MLECNHAGAARRRALTVVLLAVLIMSSLVGASAGAPAGVWADRVDHGRFLIFIGDDQVGVEDFELTATRARSTVEIAAGGATSRAQIDMALAPQTGAQSYRLEAPGVVLTVAFEAGIAKLDVQGTSRQVKVGVPHVVLENNVFSHYQVLLDMYDASRGGVQSFTALVPGVMASVPVTVEVLGPARSTPIPLTEYKAVLAGAIGVSVLVDDAGRVMHVAVPGQNARAVREEYQRTVDDAKSSASVVPVGSAEPAQPATAAAPGCFDQAIVVDSGENVRLAGTLTLPSAGLDQGARYPAVLLISGSGPQDRDGNTPPSYMTNIFRRMAERLAAAGIAVLRYDDRGVGASTGNFESAGLFDLAGDARAMAASLKRHPSIDPSRIAVVGHSEGACIASMLASVDPQIAACVIMAGASTTLDALMIEQIEYQATFDELDEASRSIAADLLPAVKQFVQDARDGKGSSVVPGNLQWLREHMQIDPVGQVRAVRAPILIVQGEKDLKVKPYHAEVLAEAARSAGNRSVAVVRLPNTTHEFLEWPYGNPGFDPMDPMRIVEGLFEAVEGWLVRTFRVK